MLGRGGDPRLLRAATQPHHITPAALLAPSPLPADVLLNGMPGGNQLSLDRLGAGDGGNGTSSPVTLALDYYLGDPAVAANRSAAEFISGSGLNVTGLKAQVRGGVEGALGDVTRQFTFRPAVRCRTASPPRPVRGDEPRPLPRESCWGEVGVAWQAAPRTGGGNRGPLVGVRSRLRHIIDALMQGWGQAARRRIQEAGLRDQAAVTPPCTSTPYHASATILDVSPVSVDGWLAASHVPRSTLLCHRLGRLRPSWTPCRRAWTACWLPWTTPSRSWTSPACGRCMRASRRCRAASLPTRSTRRWGPGGGGGLGVG